MTLGSSIQNWDANYKAAIVGWRNDFYQALPSAAGTMDPCATFVTSNSPEENYTWFGSLPVMREWLGERAIKRLRAEKYTIVNKDWEATMALDRNDVRFDKFGKVLPLINSLASVVPAKRDDLLTDLLVAGFAATMGTAYDGQYFFDTDHTTGGDGSGQSYSNRGTSTLAEAALDAAILNMAGRVDDQGEPLDVKATHIMYGPKLESVVRGLIKLPTLSGGGANGQYQILTPIMNPRLTGTADDYWFLFDLSKPLKPFVYQQVGGVNFVSKSAQTDDNLFFEKEIIVGVDGTFNAGYALPQLAFGSIVA